MQGLYMEKGLDKNYLLNQRQNNKVIDEMKVDLKLKKLMEILKGMKRRS